MLFCYLVGSNDYPRPDDSKNKQLNNQQTFLDYLLKLQKNCITLRASRIVVLCRMQPAWAIIFRKRCVRLVNMSFASERGYLRFLRLMAIEFRTN